MRTQTVFDRVTNTVTEDGEVISTASTQVDILVKTDEEFTVIYKKLLQLALKLTGTDVKVLLFCMQNAEMHTNLITLTITQKKELQRESTVLDAKGKELKPGLAIASINNSISALKEKGLLILQGRATYQINPMIAWRGSLRERDKELKIRLKLDKEEKKP